MSWCCPCHLEPCYRCEDSSFAAPGADTPVIYPDYLCGSILELSMTWGSPGYFLKYLFIYLFMVCRVLVAARRIRVAACRLFFSCGMWSS